MMMLYAASSQYYLMMQKNSVLAVKEGGLTYICAAVFAPL